MRLSGFIMIILALGAVSCGYETRESKTYVDEDPCCEKEKTEVIVVERTPEQRPPVLLPPKQPDVNVDVDVDVEVVFECCDDYGCQPCDEPRQSDPVVIKKPVKKPVFCEKYPRWHTCSTSNRNVNTNVNNNNISVR